MSHHLCESFIDQIVTVVTHDGRNVLGTLRGVDQQHNLILEQTVERVYSMESGVEQVPLGLFVIRGPNVAIIGLVDAEMDQDIDWDKMKFFHVRHLLMSRPFHIRILGTDRRKSTGPLTAAIHTREVCVPFR